MFISKIKYKEIKYVSHNLRNFYLFFILYLCYFLIYDFQLSLTYFLLSLVIFLVSYSVVYFLNDFADREEDKKNRKNNLFIDIHDSRIFWLLVTALLIFGLLCTSSISSIAIILLLSLYFLNFLYSFKPFRFRNIYLLREINIFIIYLVKFFLISEYFGFTFTLNDIPFPLFIMASSFAAVSLSLYKRHLGANKLPEYVFGSIFILSFLISMYLFTELIVLFLPLIPVISYLSLKYKNQQIPIGKYQAGFFLYSIIVYVIYLLMRNL